MTTIPSHKGAVVLPAPPDRVVVQIREDGAPVATVQISRTAGLTLLSQLAGALSEVCRDG